MESEKDSVCMRSRDWIETLNFSTRIDHLSLYTAQMSGAMEYSVQKYSNQEFFHQANVFF